MLDVTTPYLTPTAAARRLGLSVQRLSQIARAGRLPHVSTPLGRLYPVAAVDALAAERARTRAAGTS